MATSFTPELGIRIRFSEYKADWWGTRAQLEAEGFIPDGTLWPEGKRCTRVDTATAWFCIYRIGGDATEPSKNTLYRVHHYSQKNDWRQRHFNKKLQEALDIAAIGGAAWTEAKQKHIATSRDSAFQEFKNKLLGLKKRGRKPVAHIEPKEQA